MFPSSVITAASDIGVDVSSTGETEVPILRQILAASCASAGGSGPVNPNNALVPDDAPIQPPQAFVDALSNPSFTFGSPSVNLGSVGIEFIRPTWLANFPDNGGLDFILPGNAITNTDGILAEMATAYSQPNTIDLSGGTNADPTGGLANADLVTLGNNGWTGQVNIAGVPTAFP